MAVFNQKSYQIANRDAIPKVLTDAFIDGGEVLESFGQVATGSAADSVGSTYRLVQMPSNSRPSALAYQNDAFGGAAAVNIGLYWPSFIPKGAGLDAFVPGAAINATMFAAAKAVIAAGGPTDLISALTMAQQEMPLWQAAGLAFDPGIELDVVVAVSTVFAAAGSQAIRAKYVKQ